MGYVYSHTLQPLNRSLDICTLVFDIDNDITLDQDMDDIYILNNLHLKLVEEWLKSIIPYHYRHDGIHKRTNYTDTKFNFPVIILVVTHCGSIMDIKEQKKRFDCFK